MRININNEKSSSKDYMLHVFTDRIIARRNRLLVARGGRVSGDRRQVNMVEKDHRKCLYGN